MRALCLSGGGSRGAIEIGAIQAYLELYGDYDQLYGTSVGALNGTFLHQGDFETLKTVWQNIKNKQIYNWAPWNLITSGASLFSTSPLSKMINKYLSPEKIKANPKPFYVSATHINPIQSVCAPLASLTDAHMAKWILASASAPVGFPVQDFNGHQYTDGGPTSNYNLQPAIANGCTDIILLACSNVTNKKIKNILDMIEWNFNAQAYDQMKDETAIAKMMDMSQHEVTLTIYQPSEPVSLGMLDFDNASRNYQKWFNLGYNLLRKPVMQIRTKKPRV
jgi:predicted acylesterase/phospholipase RssA